MMNQSELAKVMAQTVLRDVRGLRCVKAGNRVWLESRTGERITDFESVVATLQQQFRLDEDLARDVASGFVADASTLERAGA